MLLNNIYSRQFPCTRDDGHKINCTKVTLRGVAFSKAGHLLLQQDSCLKSLSREHGGRGASGWLGEISGSAVTMVSFQNLN